MSPRLVTVPLLLVALLVPSLGAAKKPKPQPCAPGRFVVGQGGQLVTGGTGTPGTEAVVVNGVQVSIGAGCALSGAKVKARKTFTLVTGKAAACGDLTKLKLSAKIASPGCNQMSGTLRAKKSAPKAFSATRSTCGDGIFDDGGEQCDAGTGCASTEQCAADCTCQPGGGSTTTTMTSGSSTTQTSGTGSTGSSSSTSSSSTTSTTQAPTFCPLNPTDAGMANELRLTLAGTLTDLDLGTSGLAQNLAFPAQAMLRMCLRNCNRTNDPVCDAELAAGVGSVNGSVFGVPIPVFAGGIPLAIVPSFDLTAPSLATANVATGAVDGTVNLRIDIYIGAGSTAVAQCKNGTCDIGPDRNHACVIDGVVTVGTTVFQLSKSCRVPGSPIASPRVSIPLTTGTRGTPGSGGSKPCPGQNQDDSCQGTPCTAACTLNAAVCKTKLPDGTCIDAKGGISQACCRGGFLACFPTATGGAGIVRTGMPVVAQPPYATSPALYPKAADGVRVVSTFCLPGTGNLTVDGVNGLPGPGAAILAVRAEWLRAAP